MDLFLSGFFLSFFRDNEEKEWYAESGHSSSSSSLFRTSRTNFVVSGAHLGWGERERENYACLTRSTETGDNKKRSLAFFIHSFANFFTDYIIIN